MNENMTTCLIFDCDGTLVDSERLSHLALEMKLQEFGVVASHEEMMQRFRGGKLAHILAFYAKKHDLVLDDQFVQAYRALVSDLFEQHLKPCDGVVELLQTLTLPLCVASNAPLSKTKKALAVTKLAHHFGDNLFSAYELNAWKPDPTLFRHAAEMMGVAAKNCVVIEDSLLGVEGALAAGMRPILYDPHNEHQTISGVTIIKHMREVQGKITP